MSVEVRLPQLGESVTHARLSLWLKKEGERVSRGDVLAEVETDKTSVEIESPADGVLSSILVPAGTDKVAVQTVLAVLDSGSTAVVTAVAEASTPAPAPQAPPTAEPRPAASVAAANVPEATAAAAPALPEADVSASPLARRMAQASGLSLAGIRGSGPGGRILKEDIEARLAPVATPSRPAAAGVALAPPSDARSRDELVPLSTMRRVSAERLTQSKQQVPHFYLRVECAMDALAQARTSLNAHATEPISFTALTVRAVALALKRVPAANAMWAEGAVRLCKAVDLAVAVNTPQGLIAPVVRDADTTPVVALNRQIKALAEKARAGKLTPSEYSGGTCTVSNLGMFGVTSLYPIINPPQACIVGLGAIEERPVVRDHGLAVGMMMTATLAADHRVLDGATGAELLAAFRQLVEDPLLLLL